MTKKQSSVSIPPATPFGFLKKMADSGRFSLVFRVCYVTSTYRDALFSLQGLHKKCFHARHEFIGIVLSTSVDDIGQGISASAIRFLMADELAEEVLEAADGRLH